VLFIGGLEFWRQQTLRYVQDYKRSYFDDLIELHDSLGLSVRLGSAVAMASLVGYNRVTSLLFLFGFLLVIYMLTVIIITGIVRGRLCT